MLVFSAYGCIDVIKLAEKRARRDIKLVTHSVENLISRINLGPLELVGYEAKFKY